METKQEAASLSLAMLKRLEERSPILTLTGKFLEICHKELGQEKFAELLKSAAEEAFHSSQRLDERQQLLALVSELGLDSDQTQNLANSSFGDSRT